jgi:hypothetical protein
VGSGQRIKNSFLPALSLLGDHVVPVGIWSRSQAHGEVVADAWGIPAVPDLAAAVQEADVVAMSVSTVANPDVLRRLAEWAGELELVIDTPVLRLADLRATRLLRRFKRVVVAEDYMNFPQFELARRASAGGLVGEVTSVELVRSGYKYHGLALIRSFFDFERPRIAYRSNGDGLTRTTFHFSRGRVGSIVEPYDQTIGRTVIRGVDGVITDDPLLAWTGQDLNLITGHGPPERPSRFTLGDFAIELPQIDRLDRIEDLSTFNSLKTIGLSTVLSSLWHSNVNDRYTYREGLYDHLVTEVTRKVPLLADPVAWRRTAWRRPSGRPG